jgi:hypothetical protein
MPYVTVTYDTVAPNHAKSYQPAPLQLQHAALAYITAYCSCTASEGADLSLCCASLHAYTCCSSCMCMKGPCILTAALQNCAWRYVSACQAGSRINATQIMGNSTTAHSHSTGRLGRQHGPLTNTRSYGGMQSLDLLCHRLSASGALTYDRLLRATCQLTTVCVSMLEQ